ncbi:MAG TPA: pitrilysin family protein [Gemmatirosa sp.]|nr:pitrilysin family protein [Gemmatirosa sp.]
MRRTHGSHLVVVALAAAGAALASRPVAAQTLDRTRPPALGPAPSVNLPPATVRTLSNGLRVIVVEQHELPLMDAVLIVPVGGEGDVAGREGLATLTASLLDEGTTTRTALQIADQASFLGVSLGTGAGWDASQVTLHAPVAQLDSALALMADVATRPSFPEPDFERLKKERLTGLLQLRDRAPAIADRAFAQQVFGAAHPYGRALGGTEASTRALTRADVQRFYATHWRPQTATLLVVGDVRADDLVPRAERAFAAWRGSAGAAGGEAARAGVAVAAPPAARATTVYLVDKPNAPQSSVRIGLVGVPRNTPDWFPLRVMNTILGGSFTSRLNQNLRETRGYTYGASSGFDMRRAAGPFAARAEVTAAKTDSSLVEFMKELRAMADTVPADELAKAKRYLQLQLPGAFETTGDIAGQLAPLVVHGLPLDWYDQYVGRVEAVTQADVQRVARQYVDPSKFVIVVVGDRKTVEPAVRALNLGPLTVLEPDAVMGGGATPTTPAAGGTQR